jgi:hypothetical protein
MEHHSIYIFTIHSAQRVLTGRLMLSLTVGAHPLRKHASDLPEKGVRARVCLFLSCRALAARRLPSSWYGAAAVVRILLKSVAVLWLWELYVY